MRLIKSLPLLIILSFFSWDSYSQKPDSLELNFSINFLPSPHYIHESYLIINKKAFHTFDKGTLNASSNWKKRERKKNMKVWLSFYTIANSSRAFSRSKLKNYFKEEELGRFLMHYFEVMAA